MNARTTVSMVSLLSAGLLIATGPAGAVTYRCDGNLVTDSPTRGTNCVAMGSRPKSTTFSDGSADPMVEAEPTSAGRPAPPRDAATPPSHAAGVPGGAVRTP